MFREIRWWFLFHVRSNILDVMHVELSGPRRIAARFEEAINGGLLEDCRDARSGMQQGGSSQTRNTIDEASIGVTTDRRS